MPSFAEACSKENGSNTPDYILADFLEDCLAAFDKALKARNEWYAAIAPSEKNQAGAGKERGRA